MSYIKTVTILNNVTTTYVTENVSTVYEAIHTKIASVTGWTKDDVGTQLYVGTGSKQLRITISYLANPAKFDYTIYSQNGNGNVNITANFLGTLVDSTNKTLYLHYCKSKSGKTIGIGISTGTIPNIDFIIAEDANGDFSAIGLNAVTGSGSTPFRAKMVWNGYSCELSNRDNSNNNGALQPVINTMVCTSVCKMPNFLTNCMFNEVFMILSMPIKKSLINTVVLDIEGKKYQGCYSYDTAPNMNGRTELCNALAILAE